MKSFLSTIRFSTPYKWSERGLILKHAVFLFFVSTALFFAIYSYFLYRFLPMLTISDFPLPQPSAKPATDYGKDDDKKMQEILYFYETNLKAIMPSLPDLLLFCLSLSVDCILFGGKMSVFRYYYTIFALIKNSVTICLILKNAKYTGFSITSLGFVKKRELPNLDDISEIFDWFYLAFLKIAPLWSLHNFLYLPTVLAIVKFYKNVQDFQCYVNVKMVKMKKMYQCLVLLLKIFYKVLFFLLLFYALLASAIAIFIGFWLGIAIIPLFFAYIAFLNGLMGIPFQYIALYCFNKPIKKKKPLAELRDKETNEDLIAELEKDKGKNEEINDDRISTNIWKQKNKKLVLTRQKNFARLKYGIVLAYLCLKVQTLFFENYNWRETMKFYFYPPNLGFNIYRIDVGLMIDNYINYITLILNLI